ncbi:MAG: pyruvoyl-dependent arginine decarboxylase [Thermodesulfobacteriota bacterium]
MNPRDGGRVIGGFVAEYKGHASEKTAEDNLGAAMKEMNARRGYSDEEYQAFGEKIIIESLTPSKNYGTVIVAIALTDYLHPVIEERD